MKKFWIGYFTSIGIYAENEKDALKRFWDGDYEEFGRGEIQVDGVEEEEE